MEPIERYHGALLDLAAGDASNQLAQGKAVGHSPLSHPSVFLSLCPSPMLPSASPSTPSSAD